MTTVTHIDADQERITEGVKKLIDPQGRGRHGYVLLVIEFEDDGRSFEDADFFSNLDPAVAQDAIEKMYLALKSASVQDRLDQERTRAH